MRSQRGISMIEILVTLLITTIGLLGLAGMQLVNLKNVNNSQYRTQATILAYSMAEMMRSNQQGVSNGSYDAIDGTETGPTCSNNCTVSEIAQLHAYQWNQAIGASAENGGLPDGAIGTVTVNGDVYDVTVTWPEQTRNSSGGLVENKSLTVSIRI